MGAAQAINWCKSNFSLKAFLYGLAVVATVYLLLIVWILFNADNVVKKQQEKLASRTAIIEWNIEDTPALHTIETPHHDDGQEEHVNEYRPQATLESGLADAPIDGLFEQTAEGLHRPVIRKQDGLTAFKAYRRPFDVYASSNPVISIAVTGLGLSDIATESAVRTMPPDISFILSPYAATPDFWIKESRQRGHEVWLSLPLETENYPIDDPGQHTMLISAPERENQAKMEWLLTRGDGYVGFVTGYRPDFMNSVNDMRPIIGNIYHRGLGFIDGSPHPGMIPQTMAVGMKAPYSTVDVWIDMPEASQETITASLQNLENLARQKGFAVGVIHTLPVSYQQILEWIETLPGKNLTLAPLSATTGY